MSRDVLDGRLVTSLCNLDLERARVRQNLIDNQFAGGNQTIDIYISISLRIFFFLVNRRDLITQNRQGPYKKRATAREAEGRFEFCAGHMHGRPVLD